MYFLSFFLADENFRLANFKLLYILSRRNNFCRNSLGKSSQQQNGMAICCSLTRIFLPTPSHLVYIEKLVMNVSSSCSIYWRNDSDGISSPPKFLPDSYALKKFNRFLLSSRLSVTNASLQLEQVCFLKHLFNKYPATYAIGFFFTRLSPKSLLRYSVASMSKLSHVVWAGTRAGTSDFLLENWARRVSKSSAQFPVEDCRKELKKSFWNALVNWTGVGLSLLPPCWRMAPKKFSKGSVFNLRVKRKLKAWVVCKYSQIIVMALIETNHPLRHLILPVTFSFPLNTFSLSMKLNIFFKKLVWDEVLVTARLNVFVQLIGAVDAIK